MEYKFEILTMEVGSSWVMKTCLKSLHSHCSKTGKSIAPPSVLQSPAKIRTLQVPEKLRFGSGFGSLTYGEPGFGELMGQKLPALLGAIQEQIDQGIADFVVWTDADVYWLENPLNQIATEMVRRDALFAFQSDSLNLSSPGLCAGFFVAKANLETIKILSAAIAEYEAQPGPVKSDQKALNVVFQRERNFRFVLELPQAQFPVGAFANLVWPSYSHRGGLRPSIFHANYVRGSKRKAILLSLFLFGRRVASLAEKIDDFREKLARKALD